MNKNNLLNLGLLALIVVLVALVVYEPGIEEPPPLPSLLQLSKSSINRITILRDEQQDVELVKDEKGNWWMEKPLRHPADALRLDSLLRITTTKSLASFNVEPGKLAAYQLERPRVTLTLNGNTTIAFGGSTPLDQRRYVMVNNKVHLITDTLYYHLIGSFPTFLRKQLLNEGSNIETIRLPGLNVSWQEEGWQLTPEPQGFSADQVTKLLDNWKLASALEIKPYDGQAGEKIMIQLGGEQKPFALLLTARQPDLILARPELGIQYHFDASSAESLLQLPPVEEHTEETTDDMDATAENNQLHRH